MNPLMFPSMHEVHEQIARASHILLGLDFDGTLSPIVDDPGKAALSPSVRHLLETIAGRADISLAIISGRKLADVRERVGIPDIIYSGNHGFEISGPDFTFVEPMAGALSQQLQELVTSLTERLQPIASVLLENKGLTVSVHHRQVAAMDREELWQTVYSTVRKVGHLFEVRQGKKAYEIRPLVRWHKGNALRWIKDHLGKAGCLAIYLGDDVTDEDVFTSLADGITIKIGDSAQTAAQYLLPGPAEVDCFLKWVECCLREKTAQAPEQIASAVQG